MGKFLVSLKQLEHWFERQKRVLPWRNNPTIYRVWISEIMLQQTQVITVVPYFEKFIGRFPTLESLAKAPEEEVLHYWAGLGYYSRARNLHKGAQKITEKGRFPMNREEWLEVPGVGNYTAGAILSIASGQPEAILDGNVERVLSRVRTVSRQKGDVAFKERLWRISRIFVQTADRHKIPPSVLNQALMELGATICVPKKPRCLLCPVTDLCRAYCRGEQDAYPPKKKPKTWVQVKENLHCLLNDRGEVLLRKRGSGEWRAGLWDLLEESPNGIYAKSKLLGEVETRHVVTRHKISRVTQVWRLPKARSPGLLGAAESAEAGVSQKSAQSQDELRWVSLREPEVAVGSALKRTLKKIAETGLEA
jgi:A/G-specific adenine glycosylase